MIRKRADLEKDRKLREMALRDGLTGAFNRGYFDTELPALISLARRKKMEGLTLILLDIDYFKLINDTYGHPGGDEVLKEVVNVLQANLRAEDLLCRWGGEEFAVVLYADNVQAKLTAEKLRVVIAEHKFNIGDKNPDITITISLGLSFLNMLDKLDSAECLIQKADEALYKAKNTGRNQAVSWVEPSLPAAADSPVIGAPGLKFSGVTCLVVDDDDYSRMTIGGILEGEGQRFYWQTVTKAH